MNRSDRLDIKLAESSRELFGLRKALEGEKSRRMAAEAAAERRRGNERLLDTISTLTLDLGDERAFLKACLEISGRALDLSRVYLLLKEGERESAGGSVLEWVASGLNSEGDPLQPLFPGLTSWWKDMMKHRLIIRYRDIQEIPGTPDREILRARGVKSVLAVPLFMGGRDYGFIGFDECRQPRDWLEEDIRLIRILSQVITGVLERERMVRAHKESEERYASLVEDFGGVVFLADLDFVPLFIQGAVEDITGYRKEAFTSGELDWKLLIHGDDLPRISESTAKLVSIPGYSVKREYRLIRRDGTIRWVREAVRNLSDETGTPVLVRGVLQDLTSIKRLQWERDHLLMDLARLEAGKDGRPRPPS